MNKEDLERLDLAIDVVATACNSLDKSLEVMVVIANGLDNSKEKIAIKRAIEIILQHLDASIRDAKILLEPTENRMKEYVK